MRYLSLFSGIEAASEAWIPLGWECVGVSEVNPFACRYLKHHYPDVPNLGDITKITKEQVEALGHIDVVVGGFPCTDLSIAGLRKGLLNEEGTATRSGLFFDAMRVAKWSGARFILVENVHGIFSSKKGADFASVVAEMAGLDHVEVPKYGWGSEGVALGDNGLLEWCTLDAQWFGVAQRRRRMFALLDTGDWQSRQPILLERESLRGDTPPSRSEREEIAGEVTDGVGKCSIEGLIHSTSGDISYCLNAGGMGRCDLESETMIYRTNAAGQIMNQGDIDAALNTFTDPTAQFLFSSAFGVRRLTPLEGERLQGFSDNKTNIPRASDSARHKAIGNSFAVPVVRWIGKRLMEVFNYGLQ